MSQAQRLEHVRRWAPEAEPPNHGDWFDRPHALQFPGVLPYRDATARVAIVVAGNRSANAHQLDGAYRDTARPVDIAPRFGTRTFQRRNDEKRAAIIRAPRSQLNSFLATSDQFGPRLTNRYRANHDAQRLRTIVAIARRDA